MGLFDGKKGLILGVANERSIAWGIAQAARREGARLGFNYFGETMERRVRPLAESVGAELIEPLDVGNEVQLREFFEAVQRQWNTLDFLVHSIAYANKESLRGRFAQTSRSDFHLALDVSCYSLLAVVRNALPLLHSGSSILTITYLGSVRAVPNYNVMGVAKAALEASVRYLATDLGREGIRVNALSAGPVRTLAASGISGFRDLYDAYGRVAPLGRNVSIEEIAGSAVYLLSSMSGGVTGEVHYVDAGFNIGIGMAGADEPGSAAD